MPNLTSWRVSDFSGKLEEVVTVTDIYISAKCKRVNNVQMAHHGLSVQHVRRVVEIGHQIFAAVVFVAVDHDGPQRLRPRHLLFKHASAPRFRASCQFNGTFAAKPTCAVTKQGTSGCVYSTGVNLVLHCSVVLACTHELFVLLRCRVQCRNATNHGFSPSSCRPHCARHYARSPKARRSATRWGDTRACPSPACCAQSST